MISVERNFRSRDSSYLPSDSNGTKNGRILSNYRRRDNNDLSSDGNGTKNTFETICQYDSQFSFITIAGSHKRF